MSLLLTSILRTLFALAAAAMIDHTIPLFSFPAVQGKEITAAFDDLTSPPNSFSTAPMLWSQRPGFRLWRRGQGDALGRKAAG